MRTGDLNLAVGQLFRSMYVDVGRNTATAFWPTGNRPDEVRVGFFTFSYEDPEWLFKARKGFRGIISQCKPLVVYIEGMEFFQGSIKSQTAGSRGDLSKIAYLAGAYASIAYEMGAEAEIITASGWKGQLTKKATQAWVNRIIPKGFLNEHVYDAVAFGLSFTEYWPFKKGYGNENN
jgi:hypothetical protein